MSLLGRLVQKATTPSSFWVWENLHCDWFSGDTGGLGSTPGESFF